MKIYVKHLSVGQHVIDASGQPEEYGLDDTPNFTDTVFVSLLLDRRPDALYVMHQIKAHGHFACDRCLEKFEKMIEADYRVIYTSDQSLLEYDDELRYLAPDQQEIDIGDDVRDSILLAVPIKLLCSETCEGLCPHCGRNRNIEMCSCTATTIDPRWEKLKNLVDSNKN